MSAIKFGLNHMVAPALSPDELIEAAAALGAVAVELRNDIGANSVNDVATARRLGSKARDAGVAVVSLNALQCFNIWSGKIAGEAEMLAAVAAACGAAGLVLCPLNIGKFVEDTEQKQAELRAALTSIRAILGAHGLKGFVEPLGTRAGSLRFKQEALAAIDDIGGADTFALLHDTFQHRAAGETQLYPQHTALVHISGIDDPSLAFDAMLDSDRRLVGPHDRLGNIAQLRELYAGGYDGVVSLEPFAKDVIWSTDPIGAVRASMDYVRSALG